MMGRPPMMRYNPRPSQQRASTIQSRNPTAAQQPGNYYPRRPSYNTILEVIAMFLVMVVVMLLDRSILLVP